jgi:hypothetical protein
LERKRKKNQEAFCHGVKWMLMRELRNNEKRRKSLRNVFRDFS